MRRHYRKFEDLELIDMSRSASIAPTVLFVEVTVANKEHTALDNVAANGYSIAPTKPSRPTHDDIWRPLGLSDGVTNPLSKLHVASHRRDVHAESRLGT